MDDDAIFRALDPSRLKENVGEVWQRLDELAKDPEAYAAFMRQQMAQMAPQTRSFVPTPAFALEARCMCATSGDRRLVINVTTARELEEPFVVDGNGNRAAGAWAKAPPTAIRVPLSMSKLRQHSDSADVCSVIDFVVHPDVVARSRRDAGFRTFLVALAVQWTENECDLLVNHASIRDLAKPYDGSAKPPAHSTRIGIPGGAADPAPSDAEPAVSELERKLRISPAKEPVAMSAPDETAEGDTAPKKPMIEEISDARRGATIEHTLTVGAELVTVQVPLPEVESIADLELEIDAEQIVIGIGSARHHIALQRGGAAIELDPDRAQAKFVRSKRKLVIKVPRV